MGVSLSMKNTSVGERGVGGKRDGDISGKGEGKLVAGEKRATIGAQKGCLRENRMVKSTVTGEDSTPEVLVEIALS